MVYSGSDCTEMFAAADANDGDLTRILTNNSCFV